MEKLNLKNCSKKVQEYVKNLERLNFNLKERLKKFALQFNGKFKDSKVYQYYERSDVKNKFYLDDKAGVYFDLNGDEVEVRLQKDHIEIRNSGFLRDREFCFVPYASNVMILKIK